MTSVVIGVAEQGVANDLRSALSEIEGCEVVYVAESCPEVVSAVLRLEPDVLLLHDRLGPQSPLEALRDLALRRPTTATLYVTSEDTPQVYAAAMAVGARGIVAVPWTLEALQNRFEDAADWSEHMRRLLSTTSGEAAPDRSLVVSVAGAKGGVGVTTLAAHLAMDVAGHEGHRVCLVDLDVEKGDVTGLVDVRHRVSVADLAKVSDDLSGRTVADVVVVHESGVHLLLAPREVRDAEFVTAEAVRLIFAALRQKYDLVLVDVGSHVTPVQAAAVEVSDEVVVVVTPDVLALRGLRRVLSSWDSLGVRKEQEVKVLVNRCSRADEVQASTIPRLTQAQVLDSTISASFRRLEPAVNARQPQLVRETSWQRSLRSVGTELGLVRGSRDTRAAQPDSDSGSESRGGHREAGAANARSSRRRAKSAPPSRRQARRLVNGSNDSGSVLIETVGMFPIILLVCAIMWHVALMGVSLLWSSHAASAAARAVSIGQAAEPAATRALPDGIDKSVEVSGDFPTVVTVRVDVPIFAPGLGSLPLHMDTSRTVVSEP